MDLKLFIQLALSFDEVVEQPHFEKTSFRVNKKIFATLNPDILKASFKLSEIDQSVFCAFNPAYIYPATGVWGKQGWTIFEIKNLPIGMVKDAIALSYCNVAPSKLSDKYKM